VKRRRVHPAGAGRGTRRPPGGRRGTPRCASAPWGRPRGARARRGATSRPVSRVLSPPRGVGDGHPSGAPVARRLERPDPGHGASNPWTAASPRRPVPARPCSGRGLPGRPVTRPPVGSYPTISPLPALAEASRWLCDFCGTLLRVAPTGCYPAPCSAEPGLSSSRAERPAAVRPTCTTQCTRAQPQACASGGTGSVAANRCSWQALTKVAGHNILGPFPTKHHHPWDSARISIALPSFCQPRPDVTAALRHRRSR